MISTLHSFEAAYSKTKLPNKPPAETVMVNGEPWRFDGLSTDREQATARAPRANSVEVSIWFGVENGKVQGNLNVVLWKGPDPICGDVRRLGGTFSPRAPKP